MRFVDWYDTHGSITAMYFDEMLQRRYGSFPEFIVKCQETNKRSTEGEVLFTWLEGHCCGSWFDVSGVDWENYRIIGFMDKNIAVEFKLTFGPD